MAVSNTNNLVVGVFKDTDSANGALADLRQNGFTEQQVGFAVRNPRTQQELSGATNAAAGNIVGGLVGGGVIGGLIGAGSALLLPGVGPVLAGGVLIATLTGAGVGAVAGGVFAALVNMGLPENEATFYQREFEAGRIVVTVQAGERAALARSILSKHGASDASTQQPVPVAPSEAPVADRGATAPNNGWNSVAAVHRNNWQQRAAQNQTWADVEPAYRFGYALRHIPDLRGREWGQIEPAVQRVWEQRFPNAPWDRYGAYVREAWDFTPSPQFSQQANTTP